MKVTGKYLSVETNEEEDLVLTLTEEGKQLESTAYEQYKQGEKDQFDLFLELSQDLRENKEFEMINPAKVGHFIDGVIIGFNISIDENGDIDENDDSIYYCYPDQENTDPFEELYKNGSVTYVLAE